MKILLSAYACEPNSGSEPGVGWHWAVELARLGHEVWVLTRESNRVSIESASSDCEQFGKLNFLYYDLPKWARWWKKGGRGIRFYYLLWQIGAYRVAKNAHQKVKFDLVHHITFGVVRQPSFMGGLGIFFIFGPVGGGESSPWQLRRGYGLRGVILDTIRDAMNFLVKIDPLMLYTFAKANKIYVKTAETRCVIPKRFWPKVEEQLEIGIEPTKDAGTLPMVDEVKPFQILFVGRFTYWKGMHLGLRAFAQLLKKIPDARLTMVGSGKDEIRWRNLSEKLGVDDSVVWISWMPQEELSQLYLQHDIFLFPSLHDSSGNVVLEAMSYGLPVVCLNLGGPGVMVNDTCGRVIETKLMSESEVSRALSNALVTLSSDKILYSTLKKGALKRCSEYKWSGVVGKLFENA
jgi:glycosyltransferase involved in cell wall biosynthesis